MKTSHYRLLGLSVAEGRPKLTGPLARPLAGEMDKHPFLKPVFAAWAGLRRTKEVELFGLDCGLDEQSGFWAKATGPVGKRMGHQIVDGVCRAVKGKGPPLMERDGQLIFTMYQPPIPAAAAMKVLASRMCHQATGRPYPATATLQVTTACQADCYHCSAARHKRGAQGELTTEEFKAVIRETEALGIVNIVFTGGEPLLRRDIYELVEWVDKDEAIAMMFSNGLLLSEENVEKLKAAGLFSINVSIDSPEAEEHNSLRRVPRCFERAAEGMKRVVEAGMICGLSTYATPERLHNGEVMKLIELARQVGCHEITIFDTVPTGKLLREEEHILLSEEDKAALCRLEEEWNRSRKPGEPHVITQAHVNGPTGAGCYAGWFQFYLTAYGEVTPCDFTPLAFGNVREEPLEAIWDRMLSHEAYASHCDHCRMQDPEFRRKWIDPIPGRGPFPYPVERVGREESLAEGEPGPERKYSSVGIRS
jgi:MoaA/NifB/PqqE/SkfB family radical SAM enzyme